MPAPSAASAAAITPVPYPTAEPTTLIEPGTTLRNEDSSRFFIRYYKAFPAPFTVISGGWQSEGLSTLPRTLSLADIRRGILRIMSRTPA